jgi:hypothetical protein
LVVIWPIIFVIVVKIVAVRNLFKLRVRATLLGYVLQRHSLYRPPAGFVLVPYVSYKHDPLRSTQNLHQVRSTDFNNQVFRHVEAGVLKWLELSISRTFTTARLGSMALSK